MHPPLRGDERATLAGFLRRQRDVLERKCADLDAAALARRSAEPSTLSLLGLVRHLADVERNWFREVLAAEHAPPRFSTDADRDRDFDGAAPDEAHRACPAAVVGIRGPSPIPRRSPCTSERSAARA